MPKMSRMHICSKGCYDSEKMVAWIFYRETTDTWQMDVGVPSFTINYCPFCGLELAKGEEVEWPLKPEVEGETCQRCDRKYRIVYRAVPDDLWQRVIGCDIRMNLLCPKCFGILARTWGISLYWEVAADGFPTELSLELRAEQDDEKRSHTEPEPWGGHQVENDD